MFVMSNKELVNWIVAILCTFGLAFPFYLGRVWYLLIKKAVSK